VYHTAGRYPIAWNAPGEPQAQERGIYHLAPDAKTCLAEAFQHTHRIDRAYQAPWLVVFATVAPLRVLDLAGDSPTRVGASMAIHSGGRGRARDWPPGLYAAFTDIEGIQYASSVNGGAAAFALNERALEKPLFPPHPLFHRALADDLMLDPLKHVAQALGYALR
jgi:hypothetical protein